MDDTLASALEGVAGLSRIGIARLREGSSEGKPAMLTAAGYDSESYVQAAMATAQKALVGIAEYFSDEPLIRQGELGWQFRSAKLNRLENK